MELTHLVEKPRTSSSYFAVLSLPVFVSLVFLWIQNGLTGLLLGMASSILVGSIVYGFIIAFAHFERTPPLRLLYSFPDMLFPFLVFLAIMSYGILDRQWSVFFFSVFMTILVFQALLNRNRTKVVVNGRKMEIISPLPFMNSEYELTLPARYMVLNRIGKWDPANFRIDFENATGTDGSYLYIMIQTDNQPYAIQIAAHAHPDETDRVVAQIPECKRVIPSEPVADNGSGILRI
ncbi:MAG: hypothetical protein D6732_17850 [Methanobacteriota archaeon]|nr:MAG: hypothetical protein D6732_17850 [Euryarchaeota archaeon]